MNPLQGYPSTLYPLPPPGGVPRTPLHGTLPWNREHCNFSFGGSAEVIFWGHIGCKSLFGVPWCLEHQGSNLNFENLTCFDQFEAF